MTDRFVFSDGAVFTTMLDALLHLKRHPDATVREHGVDVTERFKGILANHGYGVTK
jgi:hypothetical protein